MSQVTRDSLCVQTYHPNVIMKNSWLLLSSVPDWMIKIICFQVASSSWSLSSNVVISFCVCSLAALILKLWSLGFCCFDKWKIEKRCGATFCRLYRWQTPKYILLVGVALKVQYVRLNISKVSSWKDHCNPLCNSLHWAVWVKPTFLPPKRPRI